MSEHTPNEGNNLPGELKCALLYNYDNSCFHSHYEYSSTAYCGLLYTDPSHTQFSLFPPITVLVSSDVDSGSAECISPEPLLLSSPSSNISAGFILTSSQLCGGGCVTGWRYCYYAGNEHSVSVTFALWRRSDDNVSLEVVEESVSVAEMKTLPAEQWFVCEEKSVSGGSEVMVGDQVGVVIDSETSTLRVVGEGEGEEVLVGEREDGRRGSVSESSLVRMDGHTLLVSAVTGQCVWSLYCTA